MTEIADRYEDVDAADRWSIDIMRTVETPRFLILEDVDMTATRELIARAKADGVDLTYTHVIARATAVALSRHPELIRIILGKRKLVYPSTLDISFSVSSDQSLSAEPSIVLRDAAAKDLAGTAAEIRRLAAQARADVANSREQARRLVRIIPSGALRRWLVGRMRTRISMFKEHIGLFHITSVPRLKAAVPLVVPGIGGLSIGRVEDRVVARDGVPVVRLTTTLGLVGDHLVWKATEASIVIHEIKAILESGELGDELPVATESEQVTV